MTAFYSGYYKHMSIAYNAKQVESILIALYKKYKKEKKTYIFFICDKNGHTIAAVQPELYSSITAFKSCSLCCSYYRIEFDSLHNISIIPTDYNF